LAGMTRVRLFGRWAHTFIFARREYSDVAASLPSDGLRADHPGGELLIGARTAAFQHGVKEPTIIDAYYKENP
jgi:hypothetical protein